MSNRLAFPILLFFLVVGAGVMAPMFVERFYEPPLPGLGRASELLPFAHEVSALVNTQLAGKAWVVSYLVNSCKEKSCELMYRNLSQLQQLFTEEDKLHFVTIGVLHEESGGSSGELNSALSDLAKRYSENVTNWHFVSSSNSPSASIAHSVNTRLLVSQLVLVDQFGIIRGYYQGTQLKDLKRLKKHLSALFHTPPD